MGFSTGCLQPSVRPKNTRAAETISQLPGELDAMGCVTAKPVSAGGIRGRTEATGRGVFYGTREVVSVAEDMKALGLSTGIEGKRVVIQGLGNVGSFAAKFFQQYMAEANAQPKQPPASVVKLPVQFAFLWPDEVRCGPNDLLRSGLFTAIQGKDRQLIKDAKVAAVGSIELYFTGEQLNQDDLDVLAQLVHMAADPTFHPIVSQVLPFDRVATTALQERVIGQLGTFEWKN